MAKVSFLTIKDADGNTVAEAELVCDDPAKALEIYDRCLKGLPAVHSIDVRHVIGAAAIIASGAHTMTNYYALVVDDQKVAV